MAGFQGLGRGRGQRGLLLQQALEETPIPGAEISTPAPLGRGLLGRGLSAVIPPAVAAQHSESDAETSSSSSNTGSNSGLGSGLGRGGFGRGLLGKPSSSVVEAMPDPVPSQTMPLCLGRGLLSKASRPSPVPSSDSRLEEISDKLSTTSLSNRPTLKTDAAGDGPKDKEPYRRREVVSAVGPQDTKGVRGAIVDVSANYIKVTSKQPMIYQYYVDFSPAVDARMMRVRLLADLAEDELGPRDARAFDGRILYLPKPLSEKEKVFQCLRPTDKIRLNIRIVFTNETPLISCPAVYNIIFRRIQSSLKMVQVGRDYYCPADKIDIPQYKLQIWPGYVTSISNFEGGLLLMCDVSHKVIRNQTVYDVIYELQENSRDYQQEAIHTLVGQSVMTRYNNKTYRIDDIAFQMKASSKFTKGDEEVSFVNYVRDAYNITVQDPLQPMLISRPKKSQLPGGKKRGPAASGGEAKVEEDRQICLIPELCYMTGITDKMRTDFNVMKELHKHTRVDPSVRHRSMLQFIRSVRSNKEAAAILSHWGMDIEPDTVNLKGRLFPPESIHFGNNVVVPGVATADFKNKVDKNQCIEGIPIHRWIVIVPRRDYEKGTNLIRELKRRGQNMGIRFSDPEIVSLDNDRTENYVKVLQSKVNDQLQLVVTIFSAAREDRYMAVKKVCCVEKPIPSQVVLSRTISRPDKLGSIAVNIALQINVKMGGQLWAVRVPIDKFMCVGMDVYHESKTRKGRSVGGIVGSINSACTRWYSRCAFQRAGEEMVDQLRICFIDLIQRYHNINGFLPATIFFYRDGVGDGMLPLVQSHEVPQLLSAFKTFGDNYNPMVVFNVVQKRINTRLFTRSPRGMDNPGPGTVMDHSVTRRNMYDFFLVPQSVRQGTVSPTHFVVLYDSSTYKPDQVQLMAFKTCHLYYNWPGTVRVPAPCLYAHKLAYMVGQTLRVEPSKILADNLFYL